MIYNSAHRPASLRRRWQRRAAAVLIANIGTGLAVTAGEFLVI